jgi:hypothetical protein
MLPVVLGPELHELLKEGQFRRVAAGFYMTCDQRHPTILSRAEPFTSKTITVNSNICRAYMPLNVVTNSLDMEGFK